MLKSYQTLILYTNPEKLPEYRHFQHKTKWNLATSMKFTLENLN